MTAPDPPRHILIASDLTARSDRALDRAFMLARQWGARVTVLHAIDPGGAPDQASRPGAGGARARALRTLREDLRGMEDVPHDIAVVAGRPGAAVLELARGRGADLIVTGIAGNSALGQTLLGSTAATLVRRAAVPVLVAKRRGRAPYAHVVVASDLSDASAPALAAVLRLFPEAGVRLIHAFEPPFGGLAADRAGYEQAVRAALAAEARAYAARHLGEAGGRALPPVLAAGAAAAAVADHAAREEADLVVAATRGRGGVLGALLGSVAAGLLNEVPCDVLVVPGRGPRG